MSVHDVHIQACTLEYLCVLGRGGGGCSGTWGGLHRCAENCIQQISCQSCNFCSVPVIYSVFYLFVVLTLRD